MRDEQPAAEEERERKAMMVFTSEGESNVRIQNMDKETSNIMRAYMLNFENELSNGKLYGNTLALN